ncbi:MAG: amino acid permease [Terriglobales bacterium]
MSLNLLARKDVHAMLAETEGEKSGLKRTLGPFNLVTLGIGAIIGTGIFVLVGPAAALKAGPAVVLSFVVAAIASAFAGICYSEFAAAIPIAGSAYSYGYTALGEIVAWIIGWALIMEYAFGAATVAVGWSGYINSLLHNLGINLPPSLAAAPGTQVVFSDGIWKPLSSMTAAAQAAAASLPHAVAHFNILAFFGILLVTAILVIGISESANINTAIVVIKVSVLLVFVGIAIIFLKGVGWHHAVQNWKPFMPFGWSGVFKGAAFIFFAYIGFDAVSTAAQESSNPQKDMPVGILGSLVVCTILYILVGGLLTGIVPWNTLNVPDPVALGVDATGVVWGSVLVKVGAICGLTSTMLVMLLGQSRVFYTMSSDGLLFQWASKIHKKFRTPYVSTIVVGVVVAIVAAFFPVEQLADLTNIGTLTAFAIVCASVWAMRRREPDLKRPFRTPWVPVVPILGVLISIGLIWELTTVTKVAFLIWLAIGLVIYFIYGHRHSQVQRSLQKAVSAIPGSFGRGMGGH